MTPLRPERALAHPVFWGALVLLVLNDRLLKAVAPGAITGKLSDLAGLLVAPIVLAALLRVRSSRALFLCFAATGLGFAAINTLAPVARLVEAVLPWRIWVDPSDLVTLVALVAGWQLFRPCMRRPGRGGYREPVALVVGAAACLGSGVPAPRPATGHGIVVTQAWGDEPLYAIDTVSGERLTRIHFEEAGARALAQGVVYTVRGRTLQGHRIVDGTEVLRIVHDDAQFHDLILADERRIYVVSAPSFGHETERVIALRHDGMRLWEAPLPSRLSRRSPEMAPILAGGQVVVAAGQHVIALDPGTGKRIWSHRAGGGVQTVAAVGPGVFALRTDDVVVAIDASAGSRLWELAVDTTESDWHGGRRLAASRDAVITWREGRVIAIDPTTRGTRFVGPAAEEASVGETVAFLQLEDERFALIDLTSGKLRWSRELDEDVAIPPVVMESDGIVLLRPQADELIALELADGTMRWRFDLDDGVQVGAD